MPRSSGPHLSSRAAPRSGERGVSFAIVAFALVVIAAALSFGIDLPRKEVGVHEMKSALDSAALGGVRQLNGKVDGYINAIAQIEDQMNRNPVLEKKLEWGQYKIEFGFYSFATKEFEKIIEGDTFRNAVNPEVPNYGGVPGPAMTNAIRLSASVPSPSLFSRIFGFGTLGEIAGESFAVYNKEAKTCAFPAVIGLCHLFLSQDPDNTTELTLMDYQPELHCKRPLVFSEARVEWSDPDAFLRNNRFGGMLRALAYPKPPAHTYTNPSNLCGGTGTGPNCMAAPIPGVFVVPASYDDPANGGNGNGRADPLEVYRLLERQVAEARANPGSGPPCVDFQMGEPILPLDFLELRGFDPTSATDHSSFASTPDVTPADVERLFAEIIQNGSWTKPFSEVYGLPWAPKENFPFLRSDPSELLVGYGDTTAYMTRNHPYDWTNPLCHSSSIIPNDPDSSKAVEIVVPVVMPAKAQLEGDYPRRYCDPQTDFGPDPLVQADSIYSDTQPRVVGFVKASIYDFNFMRTVGSRASFQSPFYPVPAGGEPHPAVTVVDDFPTAGVLP